MKTYIVSCYGLQTLLIDAENADDALKEARKIDQRYNITQMLDDRPDCLAIQQRQYKDIDLIYRTNRPK